LPRRIYFPVRTPISDRETDKWSVPMNAGVTKLVRIGRLPVSLMAGVGYWFDSPDSGPEGWRFRFQANFVLPKWM